MIVSQEKKLFILQIQKPEQGPVRQDVMDGQLLFVSYLLQMSIYRLYIP